MKHEKMTEEKTSYFLLKEIESVLALTLKLCNTTTATIRIRNEDINLAKGKHVAWVQSETSFCNYVYELAEPVIIPDARRDGHFKNNALVSESKLVFFAGHPIYLSNGQVIGSFCLFDEKPNDLNSLQLKTLQILTRQVAIMYELNIKEQQLLEEIEEKEAKNESLKKIANLQSHQIRQPLTSIMGLVNLIKEGLQEVDEKWMDAFEIATNNFDKRIRDIVAESMADKDLKAIRFNKMVEEIEDYAILLLNEKGVIENWNKGAELIKGYKSQEIIGNHFSVFYTDDDKRINLPQQLLMQAKKHGFARHKGWRVRKDGSKFWGSINITSIHNESRDVIGFTKVTRDLTELIDTKDALDASEELYKMMMEQTQKVCRIGGWELDINNNTLSWTSITKEIHGVGEDYIPDLDNALNFYKEGVNRDMIIRALNEAIKEGKPWDLELQIVTMDGKDVWVRAAGKSNFKSGICTKVYGTFQDINAQKTENCNL